jgi:hypothetical protein
MRSDDQTVVVWTGGTVVWTGGLLANQLFGVRKIKARINTHNTSHCHDVRE